MVIGYVKKQGMASLIPPKKIFKFLNDYPVYKLVLELN